MKRFLLLSAVLASVGVAGAQQTIQFEAALNGADAEPPNSSPFTATGTFTFFDAVDPLGIGMVYTNVLHCYVHFQDSLFRSDSTIFPSVVSIQRKGGEFVTNAGAPFILSWVYYPIPLAPCFNSPTGWVCLTFGVREDFDGWFLLSSDQIGELVAGQWYVDATSATTEGTVLPAYEIRGQIQLDSDADGIPDVRDNCPNTPPGATADENGCSIDQLCPCEGPWRNHGEYLNCLKVVAAQFAQDGLITDVQAKLLVRQAASSDCGKR